MYQNIEIYLKIIDWDKRLRREMPVLKEIINSIHHKNNKKPLRILDIGCGPGIHLLELAKKYPDYNFYGIDRDLNMIEYAISESKAEARHLKYISGDVLSDSFLINNKFDFIFSLGNSLSLIWGESSIENLLGRISESLNKDGMLFFQILNSDNPRKGYKKSNIIQISDDQEVFTMKRFEPDFSQNILKVEFISFIKKKGDENYEHQVKSSVWKLISMKDLEKILKKIGFSDIRFWENYLKAPLKLKTSDSLICKAKKIKKV
ncbi:class I SAM-dependent methyltransferase [Promethearchaeum syntrophicum]|uniref:Class I SAM-dependent methyltransferase n=1 Tax=Promethearchaeum syntrophicum TaxID=2594042 RepID=A0A5B9DB73_9ARCH